MVVRDEAEILAFNLHYHLSVGFDRIFVLNHCSNDGTQAILDQFRCDDRVVCMSEANPTFDHEKLANVLLEHVVAQCAPDWIFLLDADEFLVVRKPLIEFLLEKERAGVTYGTIKWLNSLPQPGIGHLLRTTLFYEPWAEREWQHEGHFRKAFAKPQPGLRVVVGGHYFRIECSAPEDDGNKTPVLLPLTQAHLCHYENRLNAQGLLRKWQNLVEHLIEPNYPPDAPWHEKIDRMAQYVRYYKSAPDLLEGEWFRSHRTFWSALVPPDRKRVDTTVRDWLDGSGLLND